MFEVYGKQILFYSENYLRKLDKKITKDFAFEYNPDAVDNALNEEFKRANFLAIRDKQGKKNRLPTTGASYANIDDKLKKKKRENAAKTMATFDADTKQGTVTYRSAILERFLRDNSGQAVQSIISNELAIRYKYKAGKNDKDIVPAGTVSSLVLCKEKNYFTCYSIQFNFTFMSLTETNENKKYFKLDTTTNSLVNISLENYQEINNTAKKINAEAKIIDLTEAPDSTLLTTLMTMEQAIQQEFAIKPVVMGGQHMLIGESKDNHLKLVNKEFITISNSTKVCHTRSSSDNNDKWPEEKQKEKQEIRKTIEHMRASEPGAKPGFVRKIEDIIHAIWAKIFKPAGKKSEVKKELIYNSPLNSGQGRSINNSDGVNSKNNKGAPGSDPPKPKPAG